MHSLHIEDHLRLLVLGRLACVRALLLSSVPTEASSISIRGGPLQVPSVSTLTQSSALRPTGLIHGSALQPPGRRGRRNRLI